MGAQPAKKAGVVIPPDPFTLRAGNALSPRTLVQRPPAIAGVVSWSIETRRHRGYLRCSALSPDAKKLATGGSDGIIRLWDADSGEFQRVLVGHNGYVHCLTWSPDGHTLASVGSDGIARLWDVTSGMTLRILSKGHKGSTGLIAWARDGKHLVATGGNSGFIALWDVTKSEPLKVVETGNPITGAAWSTDTRLVAVSGIMIGVQVWDIREGKTPHVFTVSGQNASSVAWSTDGKTIAGGTETKTYIWDAESGKEKSVLDIPGRAVAFSPTSGFLAVTSGAATKVWTEFDKPPKEVPLVGLNTVGWTPDGTALYGTASVSVKWCAITGQKTARDFDVAASNPVQLTTGRPLITGIGTVAPQLWDVNSGKFIGTLEGHTGAVNAAMWSRDGKMLATASADKTLRLWDATGTAIRTLKGHEGPVSCMAWADGKTLASGSSDKTLRVWQTTADTGRLLRKHRAEVKAVAWSKDGKLLASGDAEQTVLIGPPESEKATQTISTQWPVWSLAWSGNGKSLAVGVATGDVLVFSPTTGKLLQTFDRKYGNSVAVSMVWSPDSNTLLTGRYDHYAQTWPATGAKPLTVYCMAPLVHVSWSVESKSMLLSETDRMVRVCDLANGNLRSSVILDGKQVIVVSAAGHYRAADESASELVYVVQTTKGQETLTLKDFATKFKFRNNPAAAVLADK